MILSKQGKGKLIEQPSNKEVLCEWRLQASFIRNSIGKGWKFDWGREQQNGYQVYEILIPGNKQVQGRIAFMVREGFVHASLIESWKDNLGQTGVYRYVGSVLFAVAALISFQSNCDGYISFRSKTAKVDHYRKLGAKHLNDDPKSLNMYFDTNGAINLITKHLEGGMNNVNQ